MKPFRIYINTSLTFCLLFMVITLSGCWDYKDINHRVLPVALGISKINSQYEVFLKVPTIEENKLKMKIVSAKGETISKAVDTISRNIESSVDLLHVKIIIIEKRAAEEGMKDIIAGFIRARDVPNKALVAICNEDIYKFFTKTIKGTTMYDFFEKNAGWNPDIALTRVWEVYRSIHSYTHDVAIPLIISGKSTPIEQVGSAIIRNGKMVGQISSDETLLFNAFKGESSHGEVEVMDHATVMIISNTIHHKSKMVEKQPFMQSTINLKVVLLETKGDPSLKLIKQELNTLLTNRFKQMFVKIQKSEADILGLGQFYRNQITRKELNNWRADYFRKLRMDIQFRVDIQNEGFLKTT